MVDIIKLHFKEAYKEDTTWTEELLPKYKDFELKYNQILKPKYPSITDEMKRQKWLNKSIKLKTKDIEWVIKGVRELITRNFIDSDKITDENSYMVKYLIEKNTHKIYKIEKFESYHYHYSTLGKNAILSVKFDIKLNWLKNKVIIKYHQGYLSNMAFTYMTYAESKQQMDARLAFKEQFELIDYEFKRYFNVKKGE